MKAAWYERQGSPSEVLIVGEMATPVTGPNEVRIRVSVSGVNPGDVKKRQNTFGMGMPFPRVIPHSDRAGVIEELGDQVALSRIGERVWCFGAQSYRPFGTAAEYVRSPLNRRSPCRVVSRSSRGRAWEFRASLRTALYIWRDRCGGGSSLCRVKLGPLGSAPSVSPVALAAHLAAFQYYLAAMMICSSRAETASGRSGLERTGLVDEVYSGTLLVSLLCGSAALLAAIVRRVGIRSNGRWSGVVTPAALVAWFAVSISFTVHLGWGHTPGGPSALPPREFVSNHISFVVASVLPGVALLIGAGAKNPS